eukprot:14107546-Ditylum_brightwellii.AAC.1
MKPKAALLITEEIANDGNDIFLANIIMDDDTTTMSQLQNHSKGGLLCDSVKTPNKRADIGHCVRGVGRH